MWRYNLVLCVVVLVFGCGGSVEPEPDDDNGGQGGRTGSEAAGSTSNKDKPRLGDCKPGTPVTEAANCAWLADRICYPTRQAACDCICPTDVSVVNCLSDFPEDGKATEVFCTR